MAYILKKGSHRLYEPVLPNIEDWPISKLTEEKKHFLEELISNSGEHVKALLNNDPQLMHEEIARTLYKERIRMKTNPWRVDGDMQPHEKVFWNKVKKSIVENSLQKAKGEHLEQEHEIFYSIIERYANEIMGNFSPKTYMQVSGVITAAFRRLLNPYALPGKAKKNKLRDRVRLTGPLEKIRSLAEQGTVLLVPTHFSNLDSVLIGWSLDALGMPAFLYGAGLNLFDSRVFGYYMNRLGAYKVDRRKKSSLYIETLKMYSRMTLERGCHSLFFPGGTRARSGQLESRLKLGLLGTAIDAQRLLYKRGLVQNMGGAIDKGRKIFVVPLVINYHFVLEASSLIEEHLRRSGKEQYYILKDEFPTMKKLTEFSLKLFNSKSEIILSYGDPMDVFGYKVDEQGTSLDKNGRPVDISSYFITNGEFVKDTQRDTEYTRMLGEHIIKQYYEKNTVLSSHLAAFVAFNMLLLRYKKRLDLYGVLRLGKEDRIIPYQQFAQVMERLREEIRTMSERGEIKLASHMYGDIDRLIKHGMDNLNAYHSKKPLIKTKEGDISTEDMNLLYYYHNRLKGYELEKHI